MCGIAGFIYKSKKLRVTHDVIDKMLKKLEHRGPNGSGKFVKDNVSLGMRRLSIIDTQQHEIPYTDGQALHLVYNGEVYNHLNIYQKIKEKDKITYNSDTETILYAWKEFGSSILNEFNGMYAIAIYDDVAKKLTLIRDKAGEKPLYYYDDSEKFIFASEIKSILAVIEPKLNENPLSYRAFEFCCEKETLFKNIYALEPGDYLEYQNGKYHVKSYWKIWDHPIEVEDNEVKIIKDLTELLEDAILLRKKNSVHQIGCMVSGGVDSALVACITKPDFIYTGNYNINKTYDELPYAELVAKQIKRALVVVKPQKEDYLQYKDEILYYLDMPCTWTSFNMYMVLKRAQEDVKVILSGEGADELFGGYHRYHLLNHDQKIFELKAMEEYNYLIQKYYGTPQSRYIKLINRCEDIMDKEVNTYLDNLVTKYFEKAKTVIHGMGMTDFYTTMQVLLTMADRMSMVFRIENRSPFLDHRLIQYAFSMPEKYKIREGITKHILKKIAARFIPQEIVSRLDKRGFVAPINMWFGWGGANKYDRQKYKESVYNDWKRIFFEEKLSPAMSA